MDQPPPYTTVEGTRQLQELRSISSTLNRKIMRAQNVTEYLKNWNDKLQEKKVYSLEQVKRWRTKMVAELERQYSVLVDEIINKVDEEDKKVKQKKQELEIVIASTGGLQDTIKTLIANHSNDEGNIKEEALLMMNTLDTLCRPDTWEATLSHFELKQISPATAEWETVIRNTELFLSMQDQVINLPPEAARQHGLPDPEYVFLYSFKTQTFNDRARCNPKSFMVMEGDDIIVPDENNHNVKVFGKRGGLKQEIKHAYLKAPCNVSLSPQNLLVVVDSRDKDVKMFTLDGQYISSTPTLSWPVCVTYNYDGNMVVCAESGRSVFILTPDGSETLLRIQHNPQMKPYFLSPHYVAIGHLGEIVVSDRKADTVLTFTDTGTYVSSVRKDTNFKDPYGVTCGPSGHILVAENGSNRVSYIMGTKAVPILTKEKHGIQSPTYAVMTADRKLYVSEYISGLIKVFVPLSEAQDENADEEPPPPAYDEVFSSGGAGYRVRGAAVPTAPSAENYHEPAPAYSVVATPDCPEPSAPIEELHN